MTLMELVAEISVDDSKLNGGLKGALSKASSSLKSFESKAKQIYNKITDSFAVQLVAQGVDFNNMLHGYQDSFSAFLHSAENGAQQLNNIIEMASRSPLSFETLGNAANSILQLGKNAELTQTSIEQLADVSGGDNKKFTNLVTAFVECAKAGKLTESALISMRENGFDPVPAIAESCHLSIATVEKAIKKAEVPFSELEFALRKGTEAGGEYFKGLEKGSNTLGGKWGTLKNKFDLLKSALAADFDKSITKKGIMWVLDKLVEGTDKAVEGIKGFEIYIDTDEIRQKIENSAFGKAIAWIGDKISSLSFENFKKNMVDLWENTTIAWENSTIKAGLDWVGTKISAIPGSIESLKGKITEFWNTVTNWDSGPIHNAWTWVSDKISAIPEAIETLKENITGFFSDFKVAYESSPVYTAVNAIKGAIDSVISAAQSAINWLKELFGVQNSGSPDGIYPQDGSVVYDEPAGPPLPSGWKPHATGLYDVPFNGYKAVLHAGERVLTKAQADESRRSQAHSEPPMTVINNIQSVAESPSETAAYIKQAMRTLQFNRA